MSASETNGVAGPAKAASRTVDGIRIPKGVTHWRCKQTQDAGEVSLGFGKVPSTGQVITEWPIDEFSTSAIVDRWGAGDFRAQWVKRGEDGKPTLAGKTDIMRLGPRAAAVANAEELEPTTTVAPSVKPAPSAGRGYCESCGAGLPPAARFCASCGHGTGAAPPPAPPPAAAAESLVLNAFMAGQANTLTLFQSVTAQVVAQEEARTKRYQADVQAQIERERQQHERALKEQEAAYARMMAASRPDAIDPDSIVRKVTKHVDAAVAGLEERIDELEEEAEEETPPEPGTVADKMTQFAGAAEKLAPMIGNAITGAAEIYGKMKGGGGESGSASSSS